MLETEEPLFGSGRWIGGEDEDDGGEAKTEAKSSSGGLFPAVNEGCQHRIFGGGDGDNNKVRKEGR